MTALFPTQEIGSLAKPRWLLSATRQGKVPEAELREAQEWGRLVGLEDLDDLLSLLSSPDVGQRKSEVRRWASLFLLRYLESTGLDWVYDGEAIRSEMYEYPMKRIEGAKFLGWVRSWDNRYYNKAAAVDRVSLREPYHVEEFQLVNSKTQRKVKVPITGAYTLADWSFNEHYLRRHRGIADPRDRTLRAKRDLTLDIARQVIRPNVEALAKAGVERIQIDEPAATTHRDEVDILVDSFNESVDGVAADFTCHICYSDYSLLYPNILEMKRCKQLLWEFANRDNEYGDGYEQLNLFRQYNDGRSVGLGVADVHIDMVETPELVKERISRAVKVLGDPGLVFVNPDCGLRTRTLDIAYGKLKAMVKGAELARSEYG
jgi:5-methyltetrahydropteroyltriglutamate--homocysteine methyltransferase